MKSNCFVDSNIFLSIIWKEPTNEDSDNILKSNELSCCSGDVTKAITIYKFLSVLGDLLDELSNACDLDEINNIVKDGKYNGKELINEITEEIKLNFNNGIDIKTSVKMVLFDKINPILRKKTRNLFLKVMTIRTNINWSYFKGIDNIQTSFFIPSLTSLYGKEEIIKKTQKNLIFERLKKLKTCLKDDEDAINYSIAISTMNDYFITCDREFFDLKTKKCFKKNQLKYISIEPKKILEIIK